MSYRFLTSAITAVALLIAAPALAEQKDREAEPHALPTCCERNEAQIRELTARLQAAETNAHRGDRADPEAGRAERRSVLDESW